LNAVVLDTDFLSSFLKIGRLALIREFYGVDSLCVPPAVFQELSRTSLAQELSQFSWIRIIAPNRFAPPVEVLSGLGVGEQEAIGLAQQLKALLLTSDNKARQAAERVEVAVADIPGFLLSCKSSGFVNRDEIRQLVDELKEKDRYAFRKEVLDLLLS
jgi:predicted nucleic acid-binding protein